MHRPSLIPFPSEFKELDGSITIGSIKAAVPDGFKPELQLFLRSSETAETEDGLPLKGSLVHDIPQEGYDLAVSQEGILIEASDPAGFHHALETLRQLMILGNRTVGCCRIADEPAYGWRGFMLDCCRHFMPVEYIKKILDAMSLLRMSVFHWHLTDDQGWRIEIKSHPELVEKGALRKQHTCPERMSKHQYFTQEEAREIIAYAAERHIEVVPEIECPGHVSALLAAIPELGCTSGPYEVETRTGIFPDVLCIGNDKIYSVLDDIFHEIADLFPSEYIHIGGDECPHTRWDDCPKCQALLKKEGLKTPHDLQWYFSRNVLSIIRKYGKKAIGWDEIAEMYEGRKLDDNLTIMLWRGPDVAERILRDGNDIILVRSDDGGYLDYRQSDDEYEPGNLGITTLRSSYLSRHDYGVHKGRILGGQGNLWTEKILFPKNATYMIFPRLAAIAESYWMGGRRSWDDFQKRVSALPILLETAGLNISFFSDC